MILDQMREELGMRGRDPGCIMGSKKGGIK